MADDKLSGKAGLDTTSFKTGLAEMNRELRVLESGFRASAASLGDWSNDASGLELRIKSLNSQMDIQRQKVAATRAEYERIKAEKGENSRAAQDLEIKLNKETETLGKMESELRTTEGSLEEMKSSTDEAGDSVQELGSDTEETSGALESFQSALNDTQAIAKGVVSVVAGLVVGVGALVGALGGLVFSAADAAGELVDLSAKTGISTTRLQELQFIGDQVGTSLDTVTGAQARLIRSMNTANDAVTENNEKLNDAVEHGKNLDDVYAEIDEHMNPALEAFNELGISVRDSNGELRNQQDVFAEVIDALGQIENPAERDALAMEIFGKSAQELNPLIKAGSAELARLAQEAHDVGAVMDEDAVNGLEAFGDSMAGIQAAVKGAFGSIAADLVPVAQEIATSIRDLFASEAFKKNLAEFSTLVQSTVRTVVSVLRDLFSGNTRGALTTLFGADNATALLNFFEQIRSFIFDTLIPFVTTHAEEIKAALIGIGAALGAAAIVGTITAVVSAVAALASPVGLIIAAIGLLSAAWAGNWLGIRDIVAAVWNFLRPILQNLWTWLSTNIPAALQTLSSYWTDTLLPAIQEVWAFLSTFVFPLLQAIGNFLGAVFGLAIRTLAALFQTILLPALRSVWSFLNNNILPIFRTIVSYVQSTFQPVFNNLAGFFNNSLVPAFQGIADAIAGVIDWFNQMAEVIANIQLPGWMTPGSPTPLENGLVGINRALRDLNQQLPVLQRGLAFQGAGSFAAASVDNSQRNSVQVFGNVIMQGETPTGSFAAALKGRRY